jgi:two-component system, chemotaxis family, chemotaxis protein CheY
MTVTSDVLIVDDAATVRLYHGAILRDAGFDVVEAANGYEALEAALERRFDVVLADVNMPRMDGYAFVAALRRKGPNRTAPVVMISTESAAADADQAYAAGANIYLHKPVAASDLVGVVLALTGRAGS